MRPAREVFEEIDNDEFELDLNEGDIVTDVLVIARVIRLDSPRGASSVLIAKNDGMDVVTQRGLMSCSTQVGTHKRRNHEQCDYRG